MPKDKRRGGAGRLLHLNVGNVLCGIVVVILFIAIGKKLAPVFRTSPRIITASTLTDVVDIAELSTAEFTYTGIAEAYKDAEHKNLLCHIRYTAVVKAGITMSDIVFEVNHDSKTVTATLPEIKLTAYIADESKLSLMPSNPDINLHDLIAVCEQDAQEEALASSELLSSAEENIKSIVNGLLYPVLVSHQYALIWK